MTSIDGDAEAKRLASILRDGSHEERRALFIEQVRKIVIGDAELTISPKVTLSAVPWSESVTAMMPGW